MFSSASPSFNDLSQEDVDAMSSSTERGSLNPLQQKHPVLVARRNARERNRVRQVNLGFITLRDHIPHQGKSKKLSKVETLRAAASYIRYLERLLSSGDSSQLPMSTYLNVPDVGIYSQSAYSFNQPMYQQPDQININADQCPSMGFTFGAVCQQQVMNNPVGFSCNLKTDYDSGLNELVLTSDLYPSPAQLMQHGGGQAYGGGHYKKELSYCQAATGRLETSSDGSTSSPNSQANFDASVNHPQQYPITNVMSTY